MDPGFYSGVGSGQSEPGSTPLVTPITSILWLHRPPLRELGIGIYGKGSFIYGSVDPGFYSRVGSDQTEPGSTPLVTPITSMIWLQSSPESRTSLPMIAWFNCSLYNQPWYLYMMVLQNTVHTYWIRYLDLFRAFGYIERVVKSAFWEKKHILLHTCAKRYELPSYISNMEPTFHACIGIQCFLSIFLLCINLSTYLSIWNLFFYPSDTTLSLYLCRFNLYLFIFLLLWYVTIQCSVSLLLINGEISFYLYM